MVPQLLGLALALRRVGVAAVAGALSLARAASHRLDAFRHYPRKLAKFRRDLGVPNGLLTQAARCEHLDARVGAGGSGKSPLRLGLGENPAARGETSVLRPSVWRPPRAPKPYRAIWVFNLGSKPGTTGL